MHTWGWNTPAEMHAHWTSILLSIEGLFACNGGFLIHTNCSRSLEACTMIAKTVEYFIWSVYSQTAAYPIFKRKNNQFTNNYKYTFISKQCNYVDMNGP